MGILSEDKAQELVERLNNDPTFLDDAPASTPDQDVKADGQAPLGAEEKVEVTEVEAEVPSEPTEAKAEAGESEGQSATDESSGDSEEDSDLPGHRVPYKRFKSVLTARNKFRDEGEEARLQVEAFKTQMEGMRNEVATLRGLQPAKPAEPAKSETDEIDAELARLLGDTPQTTVDPAMTERLKSLEGRLYEQERQREYDRLQSEVGQVTGKYESIPEKELQQVLLHAVSRDPTVSLVDVAEQYVTWKSGIEEAAIARYLERNPEATVGEAKAASDTVLSPDVPPRPARTGTASASAAASGSQGHGSIREGTAALMKAIKSGSVNLFG